MALRLSTSGNINDRLPPEILREIFIVVVAADVETTRSYLFPLPSSKSAAMLLTFVCKRWRYIALSTPQIWAAYTLHFTPHTLDQFKTGSRNSPKELYMLWNERSADAPLAVHLILNPAAGVRDEDVKDLMISLCFKHSQRLEILHLDGFPFLTIESSLSAIESHLPLPSLRVLQITLPTSNNLDTLVIQVRILQKIPT